MMLLDDAGGVRAPAGLPGVDPSHGSLEVGKLLDHAGYQVVLGVAGGPGKPIRQALLFRDLLGQDTQPFRFVVQASKLLLKDHPLQVLPVGLVLPFPILLIKELRVGQPGPDDLLVALPDHVDAFG